MRTILTTLCLAVLASFALNVALVCGDELVGETSDQTAQNQLTRSESLSGWKLLFDGETTNGWRNYKKTGVSDGWKATGGALVRSGKGAGDLITKEKFKDFELSLEYKISEEGNSGVMFHVAETQDRPYQTGPEIQIQDNAKGHDAQKSGWLYQLYKPIPPRWMKDKTIVDTTRPAGQWNQIYLRIARGGCEVCLNGAFYYKFKLGNQDWRERVAKSKFADWPLFGKEGEGYLCLQDHGDEVAFRNIKVRRLPEDASVPQPIDHELNMSMELAFPNLKWEDWEPFDDSGKMKQLRLIELTYANDSSNLLYAASQSGSVWSFENSKDVTESTLVLDLREKVADWQAAGGNEQGLLGFAPHPNFKDNGYAYVYYSHPDNKRSILSRFTMPPSDHDADEPRIADLGSEVILMSIDQPYQNHNGGSIEFGPDGFLYIGLGDGGLRNDPHRNGQNRNTLLGSILRIDVDNASAGKPYGVPADNPFVNKPNMKAEIYAYGLRNPWKIAFDKSTGKLWCADVGQELWEEIDLIEKGGNYGWSLREGTHPFGNQVSDEATIQPVWQYDHGLGKSITGGRVYRGERLPNLSGKYVYADYVSGTVWALTYDAEKGIATRNERVVPDSIPVLAFGLDPSGEVLLLTNSTRGESIYRFISAE